MAKNYGPVLKRCRSLDIDPTYLGYSKKSKKVNDAITAKELNKRQR
jgi:small subunit ribosomal protein S4